MSSYGWQSIFWFNIPLGIAALIVSAIYVRSGGREAGGGIDLAGAGLFTGALFALLGGLSMLGGEDSNMPPLFSGLLMGLGGGLMLGFIRHVKTAKKPIIDREVLRDKPFVAANIYNLVFGAAIFVMMSFTPLYAVSIYGMSIFESGLILTPRSVSMMIASTVVSVFLVRWGYRLPMIVGTIALLLSLVFLGIAAPGAELFGIQISSVVLLSAIMFLSGLGVGIAAPASNNACIELMPDRIASITGVRGMFRQTGGAVSVAITSVLLQNTQSLARGFNIAFLALAAALAVVFPLIYAMPKGPGRQE